MTYASLMLPYYPYRLDFPSSKTMLLRICLQRSSHDRLFSFV